jgi:hypothetical protein
MAQNFGLPILYPAWLYFMFHKILISGTCKHKIEYGLGRHFLVQV